MKILLDENLPRKLVVSLHAEGHEVESIHTLRMQGLDNGKLYQFAIQNFISFVFIFIVAVVYMYYSSRPEAAKPVHITLAPLLLQGKTLAGRRLLLHQNLPANPPAFFPIGQ